MFDIQENLKKLPDKPGVYIHRNNLGEVIYVGKAVSLKNRVRQYFQDSNKKDPKLRVLSAAIAEWDYIVCGSEAEALILENNLIKKYMPRYNVLLRDDKTYPYIKITGGAYPQVVKTREIKRDKSEYFGPYSSASAVNQIVELLNKVYCLKQCSLKSFPKGFRPCLNYHIGTCEGICTGRVDRAEYLKRIDLVRNFLKDRSNVLEAYLKEKMTEASEELRYEDAVKLRDYLESARSLRQLQRVAMSQERDMDLVVWGGRGKIAVFLVREGRLVERKLYELDNYQKEQSDIAENIEAFIKQFYFGVANGPGEILVQTEITEVKALEENLTALWSRKIKITHPKRGAKKALLDMALEDVSQFIDVMEEKRKVKEERGKKLRKELLNFLPEGEYPQEALRIEAYDISNTNGVDTVGAMIVFRDLTPDKKSYRKFKIKGNYRGDDYSAMAEVLYRRLKRAKEGDEGFLPLPNLILVDGGRGHLSAATEVLNALDLSLPIAGMVKDENHRTRGLVYEVSGEIQEIPLRDKSLLFSYIGRIQEEVHRFVITYHRDLRDGGRIKTALEEIPGIGSKKSRILLRNFGSIENVKNASAEELSKVPNLSKKDIVAIKAFFTK